jgi:mannitol/fructose-specific phosphotransferase system IIA component
MVLYIEYSHNIKKLNNDDIIKKIALIEEFGNNLVDKGGISTDFFKKMFGIEKTRKFLGNVFFGYYTYKSIIDKINKNN